MGKRIFTMVAMAALLMGFTTSVVAQQPTNEVKVRKNRPFLVDDKLNQSQEMVIKRMDKGDLRGVSNLTDDQKTKIKDIRLNEQKQLLQLRNQMGEKRAKLRSLETAEKIDMKEINKTIDEIAKNQGDVMKLRAESKQKIRALLTDEQRVDFDTTGDRGGRQMRMMRMNRGFMPQPQIGFNTFAFTDDDTVELE